MKNFINKGISTLLAIGIILALSVLVGGFIWQYPEIQDVLEKIKDGTADWKTYRNERVKYEIKYPSDWFLKEEYRLECGFEGCLENILIENIKEKVIVAGGGPLTENGSSFKILILENSRNALSIEDWIKQGYYSSNEDIAERLKQERLNKVTIRKIGNLDLKVWMGGPASIEFIKGNKFYRLYGVSGSTSQFNKDLEIFNQILSTFRFLD